MNGIGFSEILTIALLAVFVIKPQHIPMILKTCSRSYQLLQKLLFTIRQILDKESKQLTLKHNEARAQAVEKTITAQQKPSKQVESIE